MNIFLVLANEKPVLATASFDPSASLAKFRELKKEAMQAVTKIDPEIIGAMLKISLSVKEYKLVEVPEFSTFKQE